MYELIFMITKLFYGVFDNSMRLILTHESLITSCISGFNSCLAYLVLYCFVWRYWCISYEIKWTNYVTHNQWKMIINPEHGEKMSINKRNSTESQINKEMNWYLTHKDTYGNHKWVKWRLFIMAMLSAACYIIGTAYHTSNGSSIYDLHQHNNIYLIQIYSSWPYTLPLIFCMIIYCKTPSILDNFYIQKELKYIFVLLIIDYIAFYGFRVFVIIFYHELSQMMKDLLLSVEFQIVIGAQFGAVLISTYWVNSKVTEIVNRERYKTKEVILPAFSRQISILSQQTSTLSPMGIAVDSRSASNSAYSELSVNLIEIQPKTPKYVHDESIISKDLSELLSHPIAFESFMAHLCHEFSMESLLSMVEFLQFQKYVAEEIGYYNKIGYEQLLCDVLVLSGEVPLSAIVYNEHISLKDKAYKIYQKYIKHGAIYAINISHRVRQKLIDLMDNYDFWEINEEIKGKLLMNIFDDACKEIKRLMNDSYKRFKLTPAYHQLVNELFFLQ